MADAPTIAKLSDLIGQIYDAALDDSLWPRFLQSLAHCFGTDQALISSFDAAPCSGGFVSTIGMDIDIIAKWAGSKEHIDVWYHSLQEKNQHSSYSDHDLCSTRFLKKSAFYADVLRPLNIQHTLGGLYIESQRRNWVFAIYREAQRGEFPQRNKELYRLLIPHFGRAIRTNQLLAHGKRLQSTLAETLHQTPYSVFVVDSDGTILWMSRQAEATVVEGDGIRVRYGVIRLWDFPTETLFRRKLRCLILEPGCEPSSSGGCLSIPRPSGKPDYHVMISPLNPRSDALGVGASGACMILLHDPSMPKEISADLLEKLYGLTVAESQVCVALFESGSLADAIDALKISRNTAKTHLTHIFEKLGVKSQAQLLQSLALGFRRESRVE